METSEAHPQNSTASQVSHSVRRYLRDAHPEIAAAVARIREVTPDDWTVDTYLTADGEGELVIRFPLPGNGGGE